MRLRELNKGSDMTARFAAGLEAAPTIQLAGWSRATPEDVRLHDAQLAWLRKRKPMVKVDLDGKELTIVPGSLRIGAPPPQPVQQSVHVVSKEFYKELNDRLEFMKEIEFASMGIIGFPGMRDASDGYCNNTNRYYKSFKEPCPYCGNYHHA